MNDEARMACLIGSGLANLSAAAHVIEDGAFFGANITIYGEETRPRRAPDAAGAKRLTHARRAHIRGELVLPVRFAFFHPGMPSWTAEKLPTLLS